MKLQTTKISKKRLKPKEYDVHLKYSCPDCGCDHWLSLLEASTINFKVVCDCGVVFRVKKIIGIKLLYDKALKQEKEKTTTPQTIDIENNNIAKQAVATIINYGFTSKEAKDLVKNCYDTSKTYSVSDLVKEALKTMRVNNESLDEAV